MGSQAGRRFRREHLNLKQEIEKVPRKCGMDLAAHRRLGSSEGDGLLHKLFNYNHLREFLAGSCTARTLAQEAREDG